MSLDSFVGEVGYLPQLPMCFFSDKHQNKIILVFDTTSNYSVHSLAKQFIIALKPIFTDPLSGGSVFLGAKFRQNAENKN